VRTEHDAFGKPRLSAERLAALGLIGNIQHDPMAFTRDEESPSVRAAFALTARYLAATRDLARAHGAAFAPVAYPYPHQVSATESPRARPKLGLEPRLYASERPFPRLEQLGRERGFPVISLLALFRERERTDAPLFWENDNHHTPRGARLFAEGVVAGLRARQLLPACR